MLHIKNLNLGYGGKTVVRLPEFVLPAREHALILGPSGCGKTTLLYAIAGLLAPHTGSIQIADTDITQLNEAARDSFRGQHMGIIFQTLHMMPSLTLLQNLLLVSYASGTKQDAKTALHALEQLGISQLAQRKISELSQGQLQRAAIARAVMHKPVLILGDEPTSALDDIACARVIEMLLERATACKASLLIATHDARIRSFFRHVLTLEVLP